MNLDVFIEHDTNKPVGKVLDAYISNEGDLMTFLHISGDPVCNSFLPEKLALGPDGRRFFNDLSMGHEVVMRNDNGFTKVIGKHPSEVSIVRQGDNPGRTLKTGGL